MTLNNVLSHESNALIEVPLFQYSYNIQTLSLLESVFIVHSVVYNASRAILTRRALSFITSAGRDLFTKIYIQLVAITSTYILDSTMENYKTAAPAGAQNVAHLLVPSRRTCTLTFFLVLETAIFTYYGNQQPTGHLVANLAPMVYLLTTIAFIGGLCTYYASIEDLKNLPTHVRRSFSKFVTYVDKASSDRSVTAPRSHSEPLPDTQVPRMTGAYAALESLKRRKAVDAPSFTRISPFSAPRTPVGAKPSVTPSQVSPRTLNTPTRATVAPTSIPTPEDTPVRPFRLSSSSPIGLGISGVAFPKSPSASPVSEEAVFSTPPQASIAQEESFSTTYSSPLRPVVMLRARGTRTTPDQQVIKDWHAGAPGNRCGHEGCRACVLGSGRHACGRVHL